MAKAVYVDTSRTASRTATDGKRKKRKPHYVYDGEKVFEVNKLTKLKDVDEVYIDVLFPEIYEEVLDLLKRGIKVYLLKDTRVLKKLRMENNMKKSDEVDAVILSKIPRYGFRPLTIQEMEKKAKLCPLINKYELLSKRIKTLKQWIKNDGYDYELKSAVKLMEKDKEEILGKIIEMFSDDVIYKEACRALGVKNSVELAVLAVELPLHLPLKNLKGLLGYTPNKNKGRYNHELRGYIARFAVNLYINAKRGCRNIPEKIIEVIKLPKKKALYRLELMTLKALKEACILNSEPKIDRPAGR